ncbi:DegV family protein [Clostridium ganghwense]|uniref:DegV family protein n=1 Tax=Clostridium ganghwense TaxID=312089 RepID=A0ABT4CJ64_9CLOT|nr:DegV family protein [Clostridium ganghwense]MCY6369087.1 DegV family protein [Clostridium ganghwense]
MAVKIVTDSTSYIPKELIKKYDISIVSLSVSFGNENFRETDIDNESFYKKMDDYDTFPTSSQPSVEEIYKIFEMHVKDDNEVVGIFISSHMSGTFSTAGLVKNMILEEYPNAKIELIDSKSNSMQLGFAVLAAAEAANKGKSLENVVEDADKNIKRSRFVFSPDTLAYLKKGGRIDGASALIGSLLRIKPILTVVEGKTEILSKVRTSKRAIQTIINTFKEDTKKFGFGDVIIHHINCEERAKKIAKVLEEQVGKVVKICDIGPVIGTHVGPGALGLVYYTEQELKLNTD